MEMANTSPPSTSSSLFSTRKKHCPSESKQMTETQTEGSPLDFRNVVYENPDPMMNDLVLDSIFKYLGGNYLKECRLVSKKWNILTIPFTRSRLQVTIWGMRSPVSITRTWTVQEGSTNPISSSEQTRGIENFVQLMESNTLGIPFGSYSLGPFDTTEGPGQRFLELCGNTAKEFCMYHSVDHTVEDVSALLRSSPKLESFVMPLDMKSKLGGFGVVVKLFPDHENEILPNLISLKSLDVSSDYANKRMQICPTFYSELIGVAENISTLNLASWFRSGPDDLSLEILRIIETLGREKTITRLKLGDLSTNHFELLKKMAHKVDGLKLKELDFMVTRRTDTFGGEEVVKLFQNTLICLSVNSKCCGSTSIEFPKMPFLKKLKLEVPEITSLRCENEDFNLTFPALKKFHFFSFGGGTLQLNNLITSEEGSQMNTMDSFILRNTPTLDIGTLNRIITVFPRLTMLECHIRPEFGADVIKKIWTDMTQLETLNIYGTLETKKESLDSLISGIPAKYINKVRFLFLSPSFERKTMNSRRNIIVMGANKHRHRPSIMNLTKLKSLSLDLILTRPGLESGTKLNQNQNTAKYLTEMAAYFGFYLLNNLKHLSLCNAAISKACSEILVKDKELISWKFKSPSRVEIIPPNWKYSIE